MTASPLFRKQLKFGNITIELRPNFAAYCAIEEKAGDSLFKIVLRFSEKNILIKDVVAVLWGGMVGTAEETNTKIPFTYNEIGDLLVQNGWVAHSTEIINFASRCVLGYGGAVKEQESDEKENASEKKSEAEPKSPQK